MAKLSNEKISEALNNLNNWEYEDNSISKEFGLNDFTSSLAFVVKVGVQAEKANHHPDILIHSWNKVKITLSTHDEGGVTERDISLAKKIETFYNF